MKSKTSRAQQADSKQRPSAGAKGISIAPPSHGLTAAAPIQRKKAPTGLENILASTTGPAPLDLNRDIHPVAEQGEPVSANAYATGQDTIFPQGHLEASEEEGRRLLAHELTHTVQQGQHRR